jgi:FkbM family methyltransferase
VTLEVSRQAEELILHDDNIWVRPRTYDKQIVRESRQYLKLEPDARDVLLDVGANIGAVSLRFLRAGVQLVVAVEPEPANCAILRHNLDSATGCAVILQAAVTSTVGDCQLWINSGRNKGMHSVVPQRGRRAIVVRTRTLQELTAEYRPTLIKMDIEGGEYDLVAALGALPAEVRGIALEIHLTREHWRSRDAPLIVQQLAAQGFAPVRAPRLVGRHPCTLGIWLR